MRMAFARFLVGSELSYEAIGVLNLLAKQNGAVASDAEFRGLRGAARVMARRYKEAEADFSAPALANDPASSVWRAYIDAKQGDWADAKQGLPGGRQGDRPVRAALEGALRRGQRRGQHGDGRPARRLHPDRLRPGAEALAGGPARPSGWCRPSCSTCRATATGRWRSMTSWPAAPLDALAAQAQLQALEIRLDQRRRSSPTTPSTRWRA